MAAVVAAGAGAAWSAVAVPAASGRRSVHRRPTPPCTPALAASSAANDSRQRSASSIRSVRSSSSSSSVRSSSSSSSSVQRWRCRGFVGEGSRVAGEYHSADFEWEELIEAGEAAVARQWQERQQRPRQREPRQRQQQRRRQQWRWHVSRGKRRLRGGGGELGAFPRAAQPGPFLQREAVRREDAAAVPLPWV